MAQFYELERAARDVVHNVKQIPELGNTKLSLIGGLAVWHYLPEYRCTDNINFITNLSTSPSSLKKRLLERPNSPFFQRSQALFYQSPGGQPIRVDISPEWLGPYLPESATKVQDLSQDEIPYISLIDLIVFKLDSSGLRSNPLKKDRDARDAAALVEHATSQHGAIRLSERQEQVVEEALCDVGRCGAKEKSWWERQMGLTREGDDGEDDDRRKRRGWGWGRGQSQARPHSRSDPTHERSGTARLSRDPNTAWHYEQLDHLHAHGPRSAALRGGGGKRPGLVSRASDTGSVMTRPKTTLASMLGHSAARPRGSSGGRAAADLAYADELDDDGYYTLEPRGSSLRYCAVPPADGGTEVPSPPPERGPATTAAGQQHHRPLGVRRASKAGDFDITPPQTPSLVTAPRRAPLLDHRSVSFLL
ncbi:hypothetical protein GGR52DRAFT_588870 [Hypoxylon sp. FL1284]|nr:hypothetical protein GGR52DRAFT_588870 [Hypoxylon sp. FL1284]